MIMIISSDRCVEKYYTIEQNHAIPLAPVTWCLLNYTCQKWEKIGSMWQSTHFWKATARVHVNNTPSKSFATIFYQIIGMALHLCVIFFRNQSHLPCFCIWLTRMFMCHSKFPPGTKNLICQFRTNNAELWLVRNDKLPIFHLDVFPVTMDSQ